MLALGVIHVTTESSIRPISVIQNHHQGRERLDPVPADFLSLCVHTLEKKVQSLQKIKRLY